MSEEEIVIGPRDEEDVIGCEVCDIYVSDCRLIDGTYICIDCYHDTAIDKRTGFEE